MRGGFAELEEDVADAGRLGDESDELHFGDAAQTHEREHLAAASEQQRPGIAGGAAMGRVGGGLGDGRGRRGGRPRRERGDRVAQR